MGQAKQRGTKEERINQAKNTIQHLLVEKNISMQQLRDIYNLLNADLKDDIKHFHFAMDAEYVDDSCFENFDQTPKQWTYEMRMLLAKFSTPILDIIKKCHSHDKGIAMTNLVKAIAIHGIEEAYEDELSL